MSTRIIVKNLPPHLTQDAFTKHFSDYASPTDSRLQTSKSGKSRRFGFVGFQSDDEARNAAQYWNNTFIGSTKVSVELARSVEEEAKTNYKRKKPEDALVTAQSARGSKRRRSNNQADNDDRKFKEFLRLNEKRAKSRTFLNDDEEVIQQAAVEDSIDDEPDKLPGQHKAESKVPDEVYEVIEHDVAPAPVAEVQVRTANEVADDADDAEWLRNRTSRTLDLADDETESLVLPIKAPSTTKQTPRTETTIDHGRTSPSGEEVQKTDEERLAEQVAMKEATKAEAVKTIRDTSRLFVRNLAYTVDNSALNTLFENYGAIQEVHIPTSKDGAPKGTAYIHFDKAVDAVAAFEDLDGKSFHGRLLHVLPGQAKLSIEKPANAHGGKQNVGEKRKEERRKEAARSRFNWNALFLNQNAVMEETARKLGVSKSELLDPTQSSAAVTMALAETSALQTIKKFFLSHGVNLQSFAQSNKKDDSILLFKNLPSSAKEAELRQLVEGAGGVIRRIVMPDIGGLAIVEVTDGNTGKSVFGKLAYRMFHDTPLYLEKGPVNTFTSAASYDTSHTTAQDSILANNESVKNGGDHDEDEEDDEDETEKATIFVKNLNFDTRGDELSTVFNSLKGFRSATVKTKPNPKDSKSRLSMGFGFISFANAEDARNAMTVMQGFTLAGHALHLSLSNGRSVPSSTNTSSASRGAASTKIVVKNLPFETSKGDLQRLFGSYGTIKSLRVPKKHDAKLRGFAFLEFISKRDAKNAVDAVRGTHLLGRRLILEYAERELQGEEGVDQLIAKTRGKRAAVEAVESGKRKVGKVNLDGNAEEGFED